MERNLLKKEINVLILTRNSQRKHLELILDYLEEVQKNRLIEIYVYSMSLANQRENIMYNLISQTDLISTWEEQGIQCDLLIVDNLWKIDLNFLRLGLDAEIPVIVEKKVYRRYQSTFEQYPHRLVTLYSSYYLERLGIVIPKIVRQIKSVKKIIKRSKNSVYRHSTELSPVVKPALLRDSSVHLAHDFYDQQVDLVIVNYNTLDYLKACLNSILQNTSYPFRIIVVDNGSTDGSLDYLQHFQASLFTASSGDDLLSNKTLENFTVLENSSNYGYAVACNQGIIAGSGEYVVVLNSDIEVSPDWLNNLVTTAKSDPEIGVVGPKMTTKSGLIVGAGVTKLDQYCSSRGQGEWNQIGLYDQIEDCYSVGGACYLVKRKILERVGYFDESYFFYFEETDLSLRVLEKGYRVVYSPTSQIIHHQEGSLNKQRVKERMQRNQFFLESQNHFLKKWQKVINGDLHRQPTRDLVVFGIIPWYFRYQRPQQISSRLAEQGYRILYINNTCQWGGQLEQLTDNLTVFSPDGQGLVYHNLRHMNNFRRIVDSIYQVLIESNISYPLLWVDVPYWQRIVDHFDREMLIYNCMDSYADFSDLGEFFPDLESMEQELAEKTDLILVSSKFLQQRFLAQEEKTVIIPNGVDQKHFNPFTKLPVPQDLGRIKRPIVGYYGAIAEWFDVELVFDLSKRMPEYSFVLIGLVTVDVSSLKKRPNIYFLGEKPYQELPKYLQWFNIAFIPFKKNSLTISTNPVKLYEYLAAGKPVVSVDLPEVKQFADFVYIAKNHHQFASLLRGVGEELESKKYERYRAVAGEDWDNRIIDILATIQAQRQRAGQLSRFTELKDDLLEKRGSGLLEGDQ